jgi:serine phosphatase RsbU (regulator of sigma subunit)
MPVGKSHDDHSLFTFSEIGLEEGDMIYTFTDGYADQFGGPSGKKLKLKALKALLLQLAGEPIQVQKEKLAKHFDDWKGKLEQVDDVLLMGVRV